MIVECKWEKVDNPPKSVGVYIVSNADTGGCWISTYDKRKNKWIDSETGKMFNCFIITHWSDFPDTTILKDRL